MRYRKKPVEVEAFRFDPLGAHRMGLPYGVGGEMPPGAADWSDPRCRFWVRTKQGQEVRVGPGEWVVREPDGSGSYPVDDRLFHTLYEPIA